MKAIIKLIVFLLRNLCKCFLFMYNVNVRGSTIMKMKRFLKYSLAVALVFGSVGTLAACNNNETAENNESEQYKIYKLAVSSGYEGTYEQWLATIKGDKGDKGNDGHTPVITIESDGYWYIDGTSTNVMATGAVGQAGKDGATWHTGTIDPVATVGKTGDLYFNTDKKTIYVKTSEGWGEPITSIKDGVDGQAPSIEIRNGYWWLNGYNTNVKALGSNGEDGHTPVISIAQNGNWFIDGVDSGVRATARDGKDGQEVELRVNGTHVQWKYKNSNVWQDLVALDELKGVDGKDGATWINGDGNPNNAVISDSKVGDIYFDNLTKSIYMYTGNSELSPWEFQVDIDAEFKLVLNDGLYKGRYSGYDFELEITNKEITSFNIIGLPVDLEFEIPTYEIINNIVHFSVGVEGNDDPMTIQFVLKDNNILVEYCEENEVELLKGTYFDFGSDSHSSLTLTDDSFALYYEGYSFTGTWGIDGFVEENGNKVYRIALISDDLTTVVEVSYFTRMLSVKDFELNFVNKEYSSGENTYAISYDDENDEYYLAVDGEEPFKIYPTYFKDVKYLLFVEYRDSKLLFNYLSGEVISVTKGQKFFAGNVVTINDNGENLLYRYRNNKLELIDNNVLKLVYGNYRYTVNYTQERVLVRLNGADDILLTFAFDDLVNANESMYVYDNNNGLKVNIAFNSDLTVNNIEVIEYVNCDSEASLLSAIESKIKYINITSSFKVSASVVIREGDFVIDLGGNVISSGSEYINNPILLIQDDYNSVMNVTVKNGYIGNFNDNKELVKTDTNRGYTLSRVGMAVHGGPNVEVIIDSVHAAGYETGFTSQGLEEYAGGNVFISNSHFYSTMNDPRDGAGAYLPGYATYVIENSTFVGATGLYIKSGDVTLTNCTVIGTGDAIDPIYSGGGYWPTGSAVVVDSAYGYVKPTDVHIVGGTYTSNNNYGIQEIITKPSNVEIMEKYSTIVIDNTAVITGEAGQTSLLD